MYGDAAEQVVRLSLEGVEVAAKITGASAKNIALILAAVLKEEHKTKGKARLTSMLKSGKELKVFSVQSDDLKKFSQEAKRYGVLYCALKDKDASGNHAVDIIARADDASKIQRIMERFDLAGVDKATVMGAIKRDKKLDLQQARTKEGRQSEPGLTRGGHYGEAFDKKEQRVSVRERLNEYSEKSRREKSRVSDRSNIVRRPAARVRKTPEKGR